MNNNLHIVMNSFSHGSRILKETKSLIDSKLIDCIYIVSLHGSGLEVNERIDSCRNVYRIKLFTRSLPKNLFFQFIKYIEYCFRVALYAKNNKINIVTIHHLPLLPLGVLLKCILRGKLVYDAHELETETYGRNGVRQLLARFVESVFIRYPDLVMVVSGGIYEWYRKRYGLENIITVKNCPDLLEPLGGDRLHRDLGLPPDKKIIIYQGGLIRGRGIEKLLSALSGISDSRYVGVFMGYGELESMIQKYASSNDNIFLKEAVSHSEVHEYTSSAFVGISYIDNPSLNDYYCLPNKFFEYIMAGLPVIVNDAPEMKKIVIDYKIGIVLDDLTCETLTNSLLKIEAMDSFELKMNLNRASKDNCWSKQACAMLDGYGKHVVGVDS